MKYYYLNSGKHILVPHTVVEIKNMLDKVKIHHYTLTARERGNSWKKVVELSLISGNGISFTWNMNSSVYTRMRVPACLASPLMNTFPPLVRSSWKEFFISLGAICVFFFVFPGLLIECIDYIVDRYNCCMKSFISLEKFIATFLENISLIWYFVFLFCLFAFIFLFTLSVSYLYSIKYTLTFPLFVCILIPFMWVCSAPVFFEVSGTMLSISSVISYISLFVVLYLPHIAARIIRKICWCSSIS